MLTAHLQTKAADNTCFLTQSVEVREKPLWWQEKGLSFTASGYGARIPTRYQVKVNNRWRRVYCRIYSNIGTLFIGKKAGDNQHINISQD